MTFKTADLCDQYSEKLGVAAPLFTNYGGAQIFQGEIHTVKCFEDNSLVRAALETKCDGGVLVVDGGGSLRCALIGDQLAILAERNGWSGMIVNGCIRDSAEIAQIGVGLKALAVHPLKSVKRGVGEQEIPVSFAGVVFVAGQYLYADHDGIIVSTERLPV